MCAACLGIYAWRIIFEDKDAANNVTASVIVYIVGMGKNGKD